MGESSYGCKVSLHGNVLYCALHRTFEQNLRACLVALAYVTQIPIAELRADPLLTVKRYRES